MSILATIALFAAALLFGGMAFFTALVVPLVFRTLPPDLSRGFVRVVFPPYYLWVLATAGAAAVALLPLSTVDAGIMAAIAGLAAWLRQVLMPRINALSDAIKDGGTEAHKAAFRRAHGLSVAANLLQMVAAAVVLAGFVI